MSGDETEKTTDAESNGLYEVRQLKFYDWDDTLLGTLILSRALEDVQPLVNWFVAVNFVHPDLRPKNLMDPYATDRHKRWSAARGNWPGFRACPVESFTFRRGAHGPEIVHGLTYVKGARCSDR